MSNVKKFLSSSGLVYFYDNATGTEIFRGKTLIDSSIEVALGNTDVRGGQGNPLLYTYYHSSDMNININDAQFNLEFLGAMVGSDIGTGTNVFKEENVTLGGGGAGTVTGGTPLALPGISTVYGWVKLVDGTIEKVTFTGSNFTASGGTSGQVVCVRYYALASGARYINVNANMLPKIGRLVIEAQLNSSDVSTNRIGTFIVEIPKAQLIPNFTISMTSDGVANTPLTAKALVSEDLTSAACSSVPILAKMTEVIDGQNWFDGIVALAFAGGDVTLSSTTATYQTRVYALRDDGSSAFLVPDLDDVTFSSSATGVATVSSTGLVTGVSAGTTTIKVTLDSNTSIDANIVITVPA